MTVHSAKGLEFPYVYVIGMEDNLFPSITGTSSESEIEEERRLFYVALTRAMKHVTLSYAQSRFRWGNNVNYPPSRFLKEINRKFLNWPALESELSSPFSESSLSGRSSFGSSGSESSSSGRSSYGGSGSGSSYSGNSVPAERPQFSQPSAAPRTTPFNPDSVDKLRVGMNVEHERFGNGKIFSLEGDPLNMRAIVDFEQGGRKTLLLKFAKLRIL